MMGGGNHYALLNGLFSCWMPQAQFTDFKLRHTSASYKGYKLVIMSWGSIYSFTSLVVTQNSTCISAKRSTLIFAANVLKNNSNRWRLFGT